MSEFQRREFIAGAAAMAALTTGSLNRLTRDRDSAYLTRSVRYALGR